MDDSEAKARRTWAASERAFKRADIALNSGDYETFKRERKKCVALRDLARWQRDERKPS